MSNYRYQSKTQRRDRLIGSFVSCPNVAGAEFVENSLFDWTGSDVWKTVVRFDYEPRAISRIQYDASQHDLYEWVVAVLRVVVVDNVCLMSISGDIDLGWLRVAFLDVESGLREIWDWTAHKDLVAVNCTGTRIRAITEEEYEYLAFEPTSSELVGR